MPLIFYARIFFRRYAVILRCYATHDMLMRVPRRCHARCHADVSLRVSRGRDERDAALMIYAEHMMSREYVTADGALSLAAAYELRRRCLILMNIHARSAALCL